jgi:PhzF family phenazine biosynthesis protein
MHRLTVVDSFTRTAFSGNPAAVCILAYKAEDGWMQLVAREMNLAETAFLVSEGDEWRLRWMTPLVEVDLCGHATLAAAHVLWTEGHAKPGSELRFQTRSGLLTATQSDGLIWLDFPSTPPSPIDTPAGLVTMLGAEPVWVGQTPFDYFVELKDEATLRGLDPDLAAIARLGGRGVIVTAAAASAASLNKTAGTVDADYVSRFFAPAAGVPEDPVTGSAHCALAPYWSATLGRDDLVGYQASVRGGVVKTVLAGNRVKLGGNAVTVSRVELL